MQHPTDPCPVCGYDRDEGFCERCGGAPLDPRLARRATTFLEQIVAGFGAPVFGLSALFTVPRLARWIVPPTILSAALLVGALVWLWGAFASWTASDAVVDLDLGSWFGWMEGPLEWLVNLPWLRAGGTLAFVLIAALAWWLGYAVVFGLVAGPFLARMQERAEQHWLGTSGGAPEHAFESQGLVLLVMAAAAGALACWLTAGWWAVASLLAPLVVLVVLVAPFREWFALFASAESRAAWQGLVVAAVTAIGALVFLPFHFVPLAGQFVAAVGAGFFVALGMLDLALERRGWKIGARFALARHGAPALVAFGVVSGFLFSVPIIGPVLMLPAASLGGAWLVCKLDKRTLLASATRVGSAP